MNDGGGYIALLGGVATAVTLLYVLWCERGYKYGVAYIYRLGGLMALGLVLVWAVVVR